MVFSRYSNSPAPSTRQIHRSGHGGRSPPPSSTVERTTAQHAGKGGRNLRGTSLSTAGLCHSPLQIHVSLARIVDAQAEKRAQANELVAQKFSRRASLEQLMWSTERPVYS